ncbi:MAG: type II secretion system protein M [Legionella sp.]|nr:type II secretion system protein M [Legionella sp.]
MKHLLTNLNARERYFLGIGLSCLCVYLLYACIYSPLVSAVHDKTAQLLEKQETLQWMEEVRHASKLQHKTNKLTQANLLVLMNTQLNRPEFRTFPYQLQQTGIGDIQLSFEKVPFALFLSWFWELSRKNAIQLKQIQVNRTDTPGIVKLNALTQ